MESILRPRPKIRLETFVLNGVLLGQGIRCVSIVYGIARNFTQQKIRYKRVPTNKGDAAPKPRNLCVCADKNKGVRIEIKICEGPFEV